MTYVELEFPTVEAARAATRRLDEMDITGEWHLRKGRGDAWRVSIASEVTLREDHIARLGGKVADADGAAGPAADDEAE